MAEFVFRDGARLTAWMLHVILLLDAELFRLFGVHVVVSSGIRTYEEQVRIFLERYVRAGDVRGRRVYDTRIWNGVRWYRISSAGTVAVPRTSNHEIQGDKAAVDIRDTGADAGITDRNSARGRWIRDWARRTGLLIASGDGFREGWHFDVPGIFRTPPNGTPATPVHEEDEDMKIIRWAANGACWLMGDESTDYIATGTELATLEAVFGPAKTVNNAGLTAVVASLKVPWAAMEACFRSQAFDNESRFGKGTSWTRTMAEAQRETLADAALAKSISDLQKAIGDAETAAR